MLDYSKAFEVHTDASDFTIGGVLVQEWHTIVFKRRRLNDIEWRHTIQVNEMTAIVYFLRRLCYYFLGTKFVVMTDNVGMS